MSNICGTDFFRTPESSRSTKSIQQRAVFEKWFLWDVGSTIKIYIFPWSHIQVISWYEYIGKQDKANYIYWLTEYKKVSETDLDPLYTKIQEKVTPDVLIKRVVLERFAPLLNLKFEFVDDILESDIRIKFDSSNTFSYSKIGTSARFVSKSSNTMCFSVLDIAVVLHEFGHAFGMQHEHQSPNGPIKWNWFALQCAYPSTPFHFIYNFFTYRTLTTNASKFDPDSIMLYSIPGEINCYGVMLKTNEEGISTKQNYKLSGLDIEWLQKYYPFNQTKRVPEYVVSYDEDIESKVESIVYILIGILMIIWRFDKILYNRLSNLIGLLTLIIGINSIILYPKIKDSL